MESTILFRWRLIAVVASLIGVGLTALSLPAFGQSPTFTDNFSNGSSSLWTTYGGTWSVASDEYTIAGNSGDVGGMSVVTGSDFADFTYNATVTVGAGGNAGIVLRASNPAVGNNDYSGYYVGLSTSANQIQIGLSNDNWTQLAAANYTVTPGTAYQLSVTADGDVITVSVNGTQELSVTDNTYFYGLVGLRTFDTNASFTNVVVTPLSYAPAPTTHKFPFLGNDNGWQEQLESVPGRVWLNLQGNNEDAIRMMASCGINALRVTVANQQALTTTPTPVVDGFPESLISEETGYGLSCGVDEEVDIARRCKANGMKVILTIDMGYQIPAAWDSDSYSQMLTDITNETKTLLDPFLNAGIQPDVIIASNESNGGTLGGSSDSLGNRFVGTGSKYTVATAVYSTLATGDDTIWPKCAGFYKQAILAAKNEITAQGYNAANTRFGLHCNGSSPSWFYGRIFTAQPGEPNFETDYYENGSDMGNVTAVPSNLQAIKLSSLVDVLATSFYPGHPVSGTQTAFYDDLNDIDYNGLQYNCTAEPLGQIMSDFSTYGLTTDENTSTGEYSSGPFNGEPIKQAIILETEGEETQGSYLTSDTSRSNPVQDGNNPGREANFLTYFMNTLAQYPFVGGAMWWEGEYGQFQIGDRMYDPGPFYSSYTYTQNGQQMTNPNYDDSPVYQALPIMQTWGSFGAPSSTLYYTLDSANFGTAIQAGAYTGSWDSMQGLGPNVNEVYSAATDAAGYYNFLNMGTGFPLSTWNNSTTVGANIEQTAVSSPPTPGQEWSFVPGGAASDQIVNHGSGLAMDTPSDTSVVQNTSSSTATQQWTLAPLARYNLINVDSGLALDSGPTNVYGGQYTSMQQASGATPAMSQQWRVISDLDGYDRIVCGQTQSTNGNAPLVLGTWDNASGAGANIEQTGAASPIQEGQEWSLVAISGTNAYRIVNRNSGMALDATNGGGNCIQNPINTSSTSQEWLVNPVL